MANFIKCSCENTEYRNYNQVNAPINIDLVVQVEKCRESYYPDNEGTPAINFKGVGKKWVYAKDQTKERDSDYEFIISNSFNKKIKDYNSE